MFHPWLILCQSADAVERPVEARLDVVVRVVHHFVEIVEDFVESRDDLFIELQTVGRVSAVQVRVSIAIHPGHHVVVEVVLVRDPLGLVDRPRVPATDTDHALEESGDLITPLKNNWIKKEQISTLGKLITGKIKKQKNEITIFKSVGSALFDVALSQIIYQNALTKGLGKEVDL